MIPVLALDPATLSLWFDPELVMNGVAGPDVAAAIELALWGQTSDAADAVLAMTGPGRTRAAQLVSAVWHEHRHFVDLLLTNYGAFRVRQFLSLCTNQSQILRLAARQKEPLVCPLDAYLDPVRRDVLGIAVPPQGILDVAREVQQRKEVLRDDRRLVPTPYGLMEFGGEAQLEALAYACQFYAMQEYFGLEVLEDVHNDLPEAQRFHLRYRWASILASDFALSPVVHDEAKKRDIVDATLLLPMLIGSLASRHWGQQQARTEDFHSGFPSGRFAAFLDAFRGRGRGTGRVLSTAQAWQLVNEEATKLWGRSVVEEIQADYAMEEKWCTTVAHDGAVLDTIKTMVEDYHALRGRLIAALIDSPEHVLDLDAFVKDLLPRLRPLPILARPSGHLGVPGAGIQRVIGYRHPDSTRADSEWWWAITYENWPHDDDEVFVLRTREAWLTAVDECGPLAKLMIGGRSHRSILAPELVTAEQRLVAAGIVLKFEPLFEFPELMGSADFFWQLTRREEATCDLCWTVFRRPTGAAISPWAFRQNEAMAQFAIDAHGGGDDGFFRHLRDWSHWLVCDECAEALKTERLDATWVGIVGRRRRAVERRGKAEQGPG